MKKYFLFTFLAILGLTTFVSCNDDDDDVYYDYDTIAQVYETTVSLAGPGSDGYYRASKSFPRPLYKNDMVLVYRLSEVTPIEGDVWTLLPNSVGFSDLILPDAELRYDYNFTKVDVEMLAYGMGGYNPSNNPTYLNNQTFRIVVIPVENQVKPLGMNSTNIEDYSNYKEVIRKYNINDNKITILQ